MEQYLMYIIWAAAIIIFSILEGMTAGLVSIWFVFGSIASLISAFCGASVAIQIVIFVLVTIVTLIATRPLAKKHVNNKIEHTNADRVLEKDAVVIEEINNLEAKGQVKVGGNVWSARSIDDSVIKKDIVVKVEKIDGVKLIVSQKN